MVGAGRAARGTAPRGGADRSAAPVGDRHRPEHRPSPPPTPRPCSCSPWTSKPCKPSTAPARALGTVAEGVLLGCDTVRKLACDAAIIPVVLGSDGAILNQGREKRLFSTDQIRALWLRDRHCTFPGCRAPAAWSDAHHLVHWIDGGPTDLANAALLCGRHHTIVHRDRLAGTVTDHGVEWDLRPGSYQPPDPSPACDELPRHPTGRPGPVAAHGRTGATHPSGLRARDSQPRTSTTPTAASTRTGGHRPIVAPSFPLVPGAFRV